MIFVQLNKEGFENDIHSLVKAFFPPENVSVHVGAKKPEEAVAYWIWVCYGADTLQLELWEPGEGVSEDNSLEPDNWKRLKKQETVMDFTNRSNARNQLKRCLYQMLSDYTGRKLPWGTLTGVRPTRLVMRMLDDGKKKSEILAAMQKEYYVSKAKAELGMEIAERERQLLHRLDYKQGYSLYVGIPFCPSTCLYCSFPSYSLSQSQELVEEYLKALGHEIEKTAELFRDRQLNTVYIGGGTPTTLSPTRLEWLITKIKSAFAISRMPDDSSGPDIEARDTLLEFTVEAGRPDSITKEKLQVLRQQGISRISINPQTMKQDTLNLIGRHHTVEQTVESFYLARELGFTNINMDLIMGLPDETLEDVSHTLLRLKELAPDNITIHSLAIKRAARLNIFREDYAGYAMVNTEKHLDLGASVCRDMGLFPYYLYRQKNMAGNFENVGYARPGMEGLYNILIMEEKQDIVALGAGAISKRIYGDGKIARCANVKELKAYIAGIDEMLERKRQLYQESTCRA